MATVYVITSGCYSNYHICAVSLDLKKAEMLQKFYEKIEYDEVRIEEYDADCYADRIASGYSMYLIQFEKTGQVHYINPNRDPTEERIYSTWSERYINVEVWAKDEESAIKIAAEKRAKYLAAKEGIS